eukprot:CAMPEP_0182896288 /NCGR_PEP_ID=MMETSP0034_2-20130328/26188_1 /TAXON_ID=156128 /ORGANISM="Nephroselmis pyriformis, Strain CCMP717" /LENGTH=410 /DNA_ID=CAMNT_0025030149 /DNA_START=63 /DNA_END=1292 /DNA_ORIENTATION=+
MWSSAAGVGGGFGNPLLSSSIDSLFSQTPTPKKLKPKGEGGVGEDVKKRRDKLGQLRAQGRTIVTLLDLKKASNIEIMLSNIKLPLPQITSAINCLDGERLDGDVVDAMLNFLPTKEDFELIREYEDAGGDVLLLGKAEQFYRSLRGVDRLAAKLETLQFKLSFEVAEADVGHNLRIVASACEELMTSARLRHLLQTILALGNALNMSRSPAMGFKLTSLHKLMDTRSFCGRTTLLHYLVAYLEGADPVLLRVREELPHLHQASKILFPYIDEELGALRTGLDALESELVAARAAAEAAEEDEEGALDSSPRRAGESIFLDRLEKFFANAKGAVVALEAAGAEARGRFRRVLEYYGERASSDNEREEPESFCKNLHSFLQVMTSAASDRARISKCSLPEDLAQLHISGSE